MTGSWKGRGNQYVQFVRVLYCLFIYLGFYVAFNTVQVICVLTFKVRELLIFVF